MTEVSVKGRTGQAFADTVKTVIVHDGRRGPSGVEGPEGPEGSPGESIVVHGKWTSGETYCPLDAVQARSTLVDHVWSLYVQKSGSPCAPSTTEPHQDTARWQEVGPYEWGNYLGGIWEVYQLNHGFTKVGQPVGYSYQVDKYILADARRSDELAVGIVREIIDTDRVVLQSSGEVPDIDPAVVYPDGTGWSAGRIYYVSTIRGRVELTPPNDSQVYSQPILQVTDIRPDGGRNGVALPWTALGGAGSTDYVVVGKLKFYFEATDGQTTVSGQDLNGADLTYQPGPNSDVFLNGVNLVESADYQATDGTSVTFSEPLRAGDSVEIWTPDRPLDLLVPSTVKKVDNIEEMFDGDRTEFPLTIGGMEQAVHPTANLLVYLDVNPQEALIDYTILPGDPSGAILEFKDAPDQGTRFWALLMAPVGESAAVAATAPIDSNTPHLLLYNEGAWEAVPLSAEARAILGV